MIEPKPQDRPIATEFESANVVQFSVEEEQTRSSPTPPPVTSAYLRAMIRARLRYFSTPLPEGYQLPAGLSLEELLPPTESETR